MFINAPFQLVKVGFRLDRALPIGAFVATFLVLLRGLFFPFALTLGSLEKIDVALLLLYSKQRRRRYF